MIKRNFLILTVVLLFVLNSLLAQEPMDQISLGHTLKITSEPLNEDRTVMVYLPIGYFESEKEYPVLYLLDGGGHFHHGSGIVQFLSMNGLMPQTIVVAIPNTARMRDFTPSVVEGRANSGGGDNFLKFLQNELIPVIDTKYRTHQYRILFGHSLTAMFSVYTFVTHPDLFDAYIAASPYMQYDNGFVINKAKDLLSEESVNNKTLYMTIGDEPAYVEPMKNFTDILVDLDASGLEWKFVPMKSENHGTVPHKTIYDGLEFIFSGWRIPADQTKDLASIQKHYTSLSHKFGFTVSPAEFVLNRLGYQIMGNKEYANAIEIFQTNVKIYPNSSNVYDSLGEAYEKSGDLELAVENYEIAVEKGRKVSSPNLQVYEENLNRAISLISGSTQ